MAVGTLLYWFLTKKATATEEYTTTGAAFPSVTETLQTIAAEAPATRNPYSISNAFQNAVNAFSAAPVNTTESIRAGIDVINTAAAADIQLPRFSNTIAKLGNNTNIARLADGSVKVVKVQKPSGGGILARIKASGTKSRGTGRLSI